MQLCRKAGPVTVKVSRHPCEHLALERVQDLYGFLPAPHLAIYIDEDVVGDKVGRASLPNQLPVHVQRQVQLICLRRNRRTFVRTAQIWSTHPGVPLAES